MLDLGPTRFTYLDARTYVHSTDVFRLFCERMAKQPVDECPVHIKSFKFIRETVANGSAFLLEQNDELVGGATQAAAVLTFRDRQDRERRFCVTDDGPPVTERRPAPRLDWGPVLLADDFAGQLTCNSIKSNEDFFLGIVEGNKTIHVETLRRRGDNAARSFRFVYCEAVPFPMPRPLQGPVALRFAHLGTRRSADRTYTLNAVHVDDDTVPIRVCFAY